jgi:small ligand-binding sensory domain FIST
MRRTADLRLSFSRRQLAAQIHEILDLVRLHGRIPLLIGSIGAGLIGRSQEAEGVAGMSLLLVSLPETKLTPVLISNGQIEESTGLPIGKWRPVSDPRTSIHGLFSPTPSRRTSSVGWRNGTLLSLTRRASAESPAAPRKSGENTLLLGGKAIDAAVLALAVKGGKIRTIVSQGCKPVGEPFTITQADENLIYALGSRPAYQVLSETFNGLSDDEKERARGNSSPGWPLPNTSRN